MEIVSVGNFTTWDALDTIVMNARSVSILFAVCLVLTQTIKTRILPTPGRYPATRLHSYPFIYLLITIFIKI